MTAERFVPDPYSEQGGERLYRTGDVARYRADAEIEYIGRIDNQVKVRGYRIELGEIEAALREHEAVREAAVVARDEVGGKKLIAYVVTGKGAKVTSSELHRHARERLPEYMVPSLFVAIEQMPLTPSGKLDRNTLPAPSSDRPPLDCQSTAPTTGTQRLLAAIWQEALGLSSVGINDNFFELGGDSILGIQIVSRANRAGLKLTARQIFQHKTIAEIAEAVGDRLQHQSQEVVTGAVPLTAIQRWFFEQELEEAHHWNQAVVLECGGEVEGWMVREATRAILRQHDALRMRFRRVGGEWEQYNEGVSEEIPFEEIDLSEYEGEEEERWQEETARELQKSLRLEEGPVMRVSLMRRGGGKREIMMIAHHLVVDAVSWGIIAEDLDRAIDAAIEGREIELGRKTQSYKEWAERMKEEAEGEEVKQEMKYWRRVLGRERKGLPVKREGGEDRVGGERVVRVRIGREETRELMEEVKEAYGNKAEEVVMVGIGEAISEWIGEERIVIEVERHGRDEEEEGAGVWGTVGWFTEIYPQEIEIRRGEGEGEKLKRMREERRREERRGRGYGMLRYMREEEEIREEMRRWREVEVVYNYIGEMVGKWRGKRVKVKVGGRSGEWRSKRGKRRWKIEVKGEVIGGELEMEWRYGEEVESREEIERVAEEGARKVRKLIAHCISVIANRQANPSIADVDLSQEQLEKALAEIELA
jgi:non-ribosomal peptide synthase protein (TIGR01720 family)